MSFNSDKMKILKSITEIKFMERGSLHLNHAPETDYEFYTLSIWEDGKSKTRYVPKNEVAPLR